jgi:hypothetical protein
VSKNGPTSSHLTGGESIVAFLAIGMVIVATVLFLIASVLLADAFLAITAFIFLALVLGLWYLKKRLK